MLNSVGQLNEYRILATGQLRSESEPDLSLFDDNYPRVGRGSCELPCNQFRNELAPIVSAWFEVRNLRIQAADTPRTSLEAELIAGLEQG
jgi:hypothetical protein